LIVSTPQIINRPPRFLPRDGSTTGRVPATAGTAGDLGGIVQASSNGQTRTPLRTPPEEQASIQGLAEERLLSEHMLRPGSALVTVRDVVLGRAANGS
jgi:hypothetical protein